MYEFSQMARIPTHLSFGKHKGEAITDLAASSEGAGYIKWLLKQGSQFYSRAMLKIEIDTRNR